VLKRFKRLHEDKGISSQTLATIIRDIQTPSERIKLYRFLNVVETEWRRIRAKNATKYADDRQIGRSPEETWLIHAVRQFKTTGRAATGNRTSEHKARVHLAKLADECGWTTGEICDIFTGADDYDEEITERMVHSCIGMR